MFHCHVSLPEGNNFGFVLRFHLVWRLIQNESQFLVDIGVVYPRLTVDREKSSGILTKSEQILSLIDIVTWKYQFAIPNGLIPGWLVG